jgi:hypothetical protein
VTRLLLAAALLFLAAPAAAQPKGEKYSPEGGRFTVRFPGKPKESPKTLDSPVGDLKVFIATYALADGSVFMVSYTDFPEATVKPENTKTLFDGVRDKLKEKDGKIIADAEVEVGPDKLPGRDIEIEKGKQRMRFRVVLRGVRLYQVAAIGSKAFATGKDATAFIDSLEFPK